MEPIHYVAAGVALTGLFVVDRAATKIADRPQSKIVEHVRETSLERTRHQEDLWDKRLTRINAMADQAAKKAALERLNADKDAYYGV